MEEDEEPDERLLDWWSKYFASIETLKEVILVRLWDDCRVFLGSDSDSRAVSFRNSGLRRLLRLRRRTGRTWK